MPDDTLITRYRPTDFDEVIGQDAVCNSLEAVLKKGTSRQFLFSGPSGTGKTTLAMICAHKVGSTDADIQDIDAATYTGIDDMRLVTSALRFKPIRDDIVKSIVVDECHMLSKAAWNSLLKSIERPPPWIYWFFCTTEIGRVPPTIKTRCTHYELKPVTVKDLYELIEHVAKAEKIFASGKGEGIMELCAKEAYGSPRQALANLSACLNAKDRAEAASLLKSAIDSAAVIDLARALIAREPFERVQKILASLDEPNAESVRHVIRDYATKVILNAKGNKTAGMALEVLDVFSEPFHQGDGMSPVVLACGRLLLS